MDEKKHLFYTLLGERYFSLEKTAETFDIFLGRSDAHGQWAKLIKSFTDKATAEKAFDDLVKWLKA